MNQTAGTVTFFANAAGGTKTQLGQGNYGTQYNAYDNVGTPTPTYTPISVDYVAAAQMQIGQGNNDTRNGTPPDGYQGMSGALASASLTINGTTVLAPVVGANGVVTDNSPGSPVWTVMTPVLGGTATFN